jgi:hypothetical protein
MAVDQKKVSLSKAEVERFTTALLSAFAADCAIRFESRVRFCDVGALLRSPVHAQLCFVEIDGVRCTLNFPESLLTSEDVNSGLIFVAKSWSLLVVLEAAFERGLSFSGAFLFEIGDNGTLDSASFCSNNPSACLLLDFEFLRYAGHQWFRDECARNPVAWSDRGDKVFWRGASSPVETTARGGRARRPELASAALLMRRGQ